MEYSKKTETPVDITANESLFDAITSISNGSKDRDYLLNGNHPQWVMAQDKILQETFSNAILTMKQASCLTGIDRANICWFVHDLREVNSIWKCGYGIDKLTKTRASFWTTNRDLAVSFYKASTKPAWRNLPAKDQEMIFKAIDAYLSDRGSGFFISSAMSFEDNILDAWHQVKDAMDQMTI